MYILELNVLLATYLLTYLLTYIWRRKFGIATRRNYYGNSKSHLSLHRNFNDWNAEVGHFQYITSVEIHIYMEHIWRNVSSGHFKVTSPLDE